MKRITILLIFILNFQFSYSQVIDTITASFHYKPKFYINLSTYNTRITGKSAIFTDLILGVSFHKRIYFGAGVTGLNSEVISKQSITDSLGTYTTNARLKMTLFTMSAEYVFFRKYPWTFSVMPFKMSIGDAHYEYIERQSKILTRLPGNNIVTYHPQITGSYKILKWFGFGASTGYLFTMYSSNRISKDFNSFTYSFGIRIFLDALYDSVFPNGICKKKSETIPDKN